MTRRAGTLAIGCAALLAVAAPASGQAFLHWGQSARTLALGGAGIALSDEPTAAFFSPAAIVRLPGTQVHVGGTFFARDGSFDAYGAPDADQDFRFAAAPLIYATHAIAEGLTGGFSLTAPWRVDLGWENPASFVGRFRATELRLRGLVFNPVLAYEPAPGWSVAAGVAIVDIQMDLDRFEQDPALSALGGGGPIALARGDYDLDGTAASWNLAAFWRPTDDVAAGLQLRGPVEVGVHGSVDFTVVAPEGLRRITAPDGRPLGAHIDETYEDQFASTRIEFPAVAVGGASWSPIDPVVLLAEVQWAGWGAVDELVLTLADSTLGDRTPFGYDDAWALRLGAEARPVEGVRVRVGFAREWSPAPFGAVSPLLPDADRSAVSLGIAYRWFDTDLDVGYRFAVLEDREGVAFPDNATSPDGRFESVEHRIAVGATRRF